MTGVTVLPEDASWASDAVTAAGARLVPLGPQTEGLVWAGFHNVAGLTHALADAPDVRWVQLPSAGVDDFVTAGVLTPGIVWTSAKGAFARPVAEHALALTLAALRHLPERARASTWGEPNGTSLFGARVLVVGAGGVATELLRLLEPFEARTVVVRRRAVPLPRAGRTATGEHLLEELPGADVVVLAAALTDGTRALIGTAELAAMNPDAVLVNIGRGGLVDTDALVDALSRGSLRAAAVDVTDPEPLPAGHPLWAEPRALVTPHTADTLEMIVPLLADRITRNARHFLAGEPMEGVVDPRAGY